ncbi:MAG: hypothetical protein LBQ67_02845 [Treponema sp.]|jgi:hypothetical protein|nr:hypothetical protein [Treponema sp.]
MSRKLISAPILTLLLGALILSSCDEFFSSSWGSPRDYDPSKIKLSASNLDSWLDAAVGNPELADALTEKIKKELNSGALNPADKVKFQTAGVKLAVEASGLGTSILTNASSALSSIDNEDEGAVKGLLSDVQNSFKSNNGAKAAADIAEMVGGGLSSNDGATPEFDAAYAAAVTPSDAAQAVLVLALAVVDANFAEVELDEYDDLDIGLTVDEGAVKIETDNGGTPSDEAVALAAYLNLIAQDTTGKFENNPVTKAIKEAFGL